ncbi:MAG: DNA-binding protein Alba [Canidatus Methanoxibalbensis ujae]|nr:DNA-binding protein Alba [Candidatus Methanoxibalbensis ujae]MCW7079057.1 DNA-binding protein Alba [Candidatus Methanoxibalbensis ujae]RLG37100.1 MAG: DNA-binding protein Alba [Methanosarcinales archaeon]
MAEENVIYIGNKNVMSYVLAVVTQFNNGCEEVVLKARGRAISRAVDTAEVIRNKFMPGVQVKDIRIGTEELQGEQGEKISVSSIEIVLRMEK